MNKKKGKNNPFFGKHHTKVTRKRMSELKKIYFKTHHSSQWLGGRRKDERGYILIYSPNHPRATRHNYVYEHRLVMEQNIGRYLKRNEIVHHLNGVRDDNRIENLIITTLKKHQHNTIVKQLQNRIRDLEKLLDEKK